MEFENLQIIEENAMEIKNIVDVCINSIEYEPEDSAPIKYLYFFELLQKKSEIIISQF